MKRLPLGKVVLTLAALYPPIGAFAMDWNETHLYNPRWSGHAKFHDAQTLSLSAQCAALTLWQVWRPGPDSRSRLNWTALLVGLLPAYDRAGLAVDLGLAGGGDATEDGRDDARFLLVQVSGEVGGDGLRVRLLHARERLESCRSHRGHHAATVVVSSRPGHQTGVLELDDAAGEPAAAEKYLFCQLRHPDPVAGSEPDLDQDVVPRQRHAAVAT